MKGKEIRVRRKEQEKEDRLMKRCEKNKKGGIEEAGS